MRKDVIQKPSQWASSPVKEGNMNDKEKLAECVKQMMDRASEQEMRLVYIAVRGILKK